MFSSTCCLPDTNHRKLTDTTSPAVNGTCPGCKHRIHLKRVQAVIDTSAAFMSQEDEEEIILQSATELWKRYFASARQCSVQRRLDFGRSHKKQLQVAGVTERDVVAKREKDVAKQVSVWKKAGLDKDMLARMHAASQTAWTPALQKEEDFQKNKQFVRLAQTFMEGGALDADIAQHADFDDKVVQLTTRQDKADADNIRRREDIPSDSTFPIAHSPTSHMGFLNARTRMFFNIGSKVTAPILIQTCGVHVHSSLQWISFGLLHSLFCLCHPRGPAIGE